VEEDDVGIRWSSEEGTAPMDDVLLITACFLISACMRTGGRSSISIRPTCLAVTG
jgi:hypothetical protein